ncbi:unnamed protein product [Pieris macdunnoughi]|uniref:Uncharacterized protein n=1 Tax=Pieris macdunnoughi TaxID=345717 RepID=A0A821W551_9NEOP|nr:unnamed protein product [Pieris macdunnoughi]
MIWNNLDSSSLVDRSEVGSNIAFCIVICTLIAKAYKRNYNSRESGTNDADLFKAEIEPVTLTIKKKEVKVEVDEHPRPQTTLESLKKLPPVFKKEGLVAAGSASGISDGAGALVLASEGATKNLKPLARLVGWSYVGVDPSIMGLGPVPAIENLLKVTKLSLNDVDLIEVSSSFYLWTKVGWIYVSFKKCRNKGGIVLAPAPQPKTPSPLIMVV